MKISIITATFNSEKFILDALNSYSKQNYDNKELIIIDGCSSDRTINLIKSSNSKIDKFIIESDDGLYSALNKGINNATGDVIGFLHSDDCYTDSTVLSNIMDIFLKNDSIAAVYGNLDYVSSNNISRIVRSWISEPFKYEFLKNGWMPPHPALFVKRSWYEKIGCFDEKYKISSDYDSILKFFSNSKFTSIYVPKTFVKMRVGGASNNSIKSLFTKSTEDFQILRHNGFNFWNSIYALIFKIFSKIKQFL